jgi:hypothetical protein
MAFTGDGFGLPERIPVDGATRFGANPPERGYLLLNGKFNAAVSIPTDDASRRSWRSSRYWMPDLCGWEENMLMAPRRGAKAFWLAAEAVA